MDNTLKRLCKKYNVDPEIIEEIIQLEKDNVHKKTRRGIFGDLRYIVDQAVKEGDFNDN
ncbi:MAG: DNA modification system-associated small protein [Candidatus Woesearchaeota archaeon]